MLYQFSSVSGNFSLCSVVRMSGRQTKAASKVVEKTDKKNKVSGKRKARVIENPVETRKVSTRSKAAKSVPDKDLYPEVIVVNKEGDNSDNPVEIGGVETSSSLDNSEKSVKDLLLALKLQGEEHARELENLRRERAQDKEAEAEREKMLEARVVEKFRNGLRAELDEAEEKQELFFRIASRKLERPFKKFKFPGDERYYNQLQELKAVLEEAEIHLDKELPGSSKAWNPLKELASKLTGFEEDVVMAQVSKHGWKAVDRYHDRTRGFKFVEDPEKAKGLREVEKEFDREYR